MISPSWLKDAVHQDNLLDAVGRQITKVCSAVILMMAVFTGLLLITHSEKLNVTSDASRCVAM